MPTAFLVLVLMLSGVTPAQASVTVIADVRLWNVDVSTGIIDYEIDVVGTGLAEPGGPCESDSCAPKLEFWYREGTTELDQHGAAGASYPSRTSSIRHTYSLQDTQFMEVTHVRAKIDGWYSAWVTLSPPYPDAELLPEIHRWWVDQATGAVDFNVRVAGTGLGQVGGPCASGLNSCKAYIEWWDLDADPDVRRRRIGDRWWPGRTWQFEEEFGGAGYSSYGRVTHVRAVMSNLNSAWVPVSELVVDDVTFAPHLALLANVPRSQLCEPLPFSPGSADGDSLPDALEACEAGVAAGNSLKAILDATAVAAGVTAGTLAVLLVSDALISGHPQQTDQDNDGRPDTPVQPVADAILLRLLAERNIHDPGRSSMERLVRACRDLTAGARLPLKFGKHPCEAYAIFSPGYDVFEAARHDEKAIRANPIWVRLHNVTAAQKESEGIPRSWYSGPPCDEASSLAGTACDEYPFYASAEGGPGASLEVIDAGHNSLEGSKYSGFKSSCQIPETTSAVPSESSAFLVIPRYVDASDVTTWYCLP